MLTLIPDANVCKFVDREAIKVIKKGLGKCFLVPLTL